MYLSGAWNSHFLHGLGTPYAGYLQVVPRLLAQIVVLFPVADAAAVTALLAAAVAAASAVFVFLSSAEVIRSVPLRLVVSLAPAVLAVSGLELLAIFCNLHWYLIFASFWAFLWRKTTTARLLASAAVVAAATLSDPLTGLYAPLRSLSAPTDVVSATSSWSAFSRAARRSSSPSPATARPRPLPTRVISRRSSATTSPRRSSSAIGSSRGSGAVSAIASSSVPSRPRLPGSAGRASFRRAARLWIGVALVYSLTFFVVSMMLRGTAPVWPPVSPGADSRYFFLPVVFIVAALCIGLDGVSLAGRTRAAGAGRA